MHALVFRENYPMITNLITIEELNWSVIDDKPVN